MDETHNVDAIPIFNHEEQQRHFGLDCGDAVCFAAGSWLPGGEHIRKVTVKNISKRTIKFKYELPRTKYFSMAFPTLITLSPGTHTILDVAFRPVKLEECDDFVVFHVHLIENGVSAFSGKFKLPCIAQIAALLVELPSGLDFGFCPTAEITKRTFLIKNIGQINAMFRWELAGAGDESQPFSVTPSSGCVTAGNDVELTICFSPMLASVYVLTMKCEVWEDNNGRYGNQHIEMFMKVSGISKFTHISVSDSEISFGDILVGAPSSKESPTEKSFLLRNRSLVQATFEIRNVENDTHPVFFFSPLSGIVPPESTMTVQVKYIPLSVGTFTCDHFDIVTPSGHCEQVTCKGKAVGPIVYLRKKNIDANFVQTKSLDFKDVAIGKLASRVLNLRNASPVDVRFSIDCRQRGIFEVDTTNGIISPFLDFNVTFSFTPTKVGNFCRRIFIMIQNQNLLYVDVLGTAYNNKDRPSPFQQAHIDAYHLRKISGLGMLNPDSLETYWMENGDDLFLQGALRRAKEQEAYLISNPDNPTTKCPPPEAQTDTDMLKFRQHQVLTRSGEASLADVATSHEYFVTGTDSQNPIVLSSEILDFGGCAATFAHTPTRKLMHVKNNTDGKVTCTWQIATDSHSHGMCFSISPISCDIVSGETAEFQVQFEPKLMNSYYLADLEGSVSFKSNRTFRLVNIETFTPPWSIVAKVCGHTFGSPTEHFLSKLIFRLSRRTVHFPPCFLGDSVFQTVLVENPSDTPALFKFQSDVDGTFACKPTWGLIAAKSFQLIHIRFTPMQIGIYSRHIQCIINSSDGTAEQLELFGICSLPKLAVQDTFLTGTALMDDNDVSILEREANIYIQPTSVSLISTRCITIANISRVPLIFRWDIHPKYQDVFSLSPKLGRLNGRQSVNISCIFTPQGIRDYCGKTILCAKPISIPWSLQEHQTPIPVLHELTVFIRSKGTIGVIEFIPNELKFDAILVKTTAHKSFTMCNNADCALSFTLDHKVKVISSLLDDGDSEPENDNKPFSKDEKIHFSHENGIIPARSRLKIQATFRSITAGLFEFDVSCIVSSILKSHDNQDVALTSTIDTGLNLTLVTHCHIQAEASFPSIAFVDIRVPGIPTHQAWNQFCCLNINQYLAAPVSDEGLEQVMQDAVSTPSSDVKLRHFAISFTPAPHGSPMQQAFIRVMNPGNLVVTFSMLYPREDDIEMDLWAENGVLKADEARTQSIMDAKVFNIFPRRATILPNESMDVVFTYSYTSMLYNGVHDLPLRLQVEQGKQLIIDLHGHTLSASEPKLFVAQDTIYLSPVMIGEHRRITFTDNAKLMKGNNANYISPQQISNMNADSESSLNLQDYNNTYLEQSPLQQIEVFNRGNCCLCLEVCTTDSFSKINSENFDYPVLYSPSSRETQLVPSHSSVFIDVHFNPITAKRYEAKIVLRAQGLQGSLYKEAILLTIVAIGYHPHEMSFASIKQDLALMSPPAKQLANVSGYNCVFVTDVVDFNHIPMYSHASKVLILQNSEEKKSFSFSWDTQHILVLDGCISFSPSCGFLKPGESIVVQVLLQTKGRHMVINHDIACTIAPALSCPMDGSHRPTSQKVSTRFGDSNYLTNDIKSRPPTLNRFENRAERNGAKCENRSSVIERSTSTQKSVSICAHEQKIGSTPVTSSMTQGTSLPTIETAEISNLPLFIHINAHVLPVEVFEILYPLSTQQLYPLPHLPNPASITDKSLNSSLPNLIHDHPKDLRDENANFLYDILEMLVVDVLGSASVQEAVEKQIQPSHIRDRAMLHGSCNRNAKYVDLKGGNLPDHIKTTLDNEAQYIISTIMENTVFNIVQEIFYTDIEEDLRCVPRKIVFQ